MEFFRFKTLILGTSGSFQARMVSGAGWSVLSNVLSRLFALATTVTAVRILSPASYGKFGVISATLLSFVTVFGLGMGVVTTKLVAQYRGTHPEDTASIVHSALWIATVAGLFGAIVLGFGASFVSEGLLNTPSLSFELRLIAIALPLVSLATAQNGVLTGVEAFGTIARINVGASCLQLISTVLLSWSWGLTGAVISLAVGALLQCCIQGIALRVSLRQNAIPPKARVKWGSISLALRMGIPVTLAAMLFVPASWLCSSILVRQPDGFHQNAIATVADQWFYLVLTIPAIIGQVLLPILTNHYAQGDAVASRQALKVVVLANAMISLLPPLLIIPISPLLMKIYGDQYAAHWSVLALMVAAATVAAILSPAGQVLAATGRMWLAFAMNFGWAAVYFIATYYFVVRSQQGAKGLATARLVAYAFHAGWTLWYLHATLKRPSDVHVAKA